MHLAQTDRPAIVFLHFLGGSSRSWAPLLANLNGTVRPIALDLPGFGDARDAPGDSVAAMADAVAASIGAQRLSTWALVGHSMGAKVATVLARRAEDGESGLAGLSRLTLVAGSPPSPEPMDEHKRAEMLSWFAEEPSARLRQAQDYISDNTTEPLPPDLSKAAVDDVLRADPVRWRAWLEGGSREDWARRVGILRTPTLIVTGTDDPLLGPEGQARFTASHFAESRHVSLSGAKHLLPFERTSELAELIQEYLR